MTFLEAVLVAYFAVLIIGFRNSLVFGVWDTSSAITVQTAQPSFFIITTLSVND